MTTVDQVRPQPSILVFGDAGADVYYVGEPRGLSAEAPVPVLRQTRVLALPGMAANVAALLGALGVDASLCQPANPHFPVKNRVITGDGHQLARWDVDDWCTPYTADDFQRLAGDIRGATSIIVADYGKGSIDKYTQSKLLSVIQGTPIQLYVDTKGDPMGWLGENVTLFPNAKEYQQWENNYRWLPQVVYKRGAQGIAYLQFASPVHSLEANAMMVQNVCGAGDMVIAAWAVGRAKGYSIEQSLAYANEAAACLVEQAYDDRGVSWEDVVARYEYRTGGNGYGSEGCDCDQSGCGDLYDLLGSQGGIPDSTGDPGSATGSKGPDLNPERP